MTDRFFTAPRIAFMTAAIAVGTATAAVVRLSEQSTGTSGAATPADELEATQQTGAQAAATAAPKRGAATGTGTGSGVAATGVPPAALTPPKLQGMRMASAAPSPKGLELKLEVALQTSVVAGKRDWLSIRALCLVNDAWVDGGAMVFLDKVSPGTTVVETRLRLDGVRELIVTPSACRFAIDYTRGFRDRVPIARRCWDGTTFSDAPCAPIDRGDKVPVELGAVAVTTSVARRRAYSPTTPRYLEVAVDGRVRGSLRGWKVEATTTCTMSDGSAAHTDVSQVFLHQVAEGEAFSQKKLYPFLRAKLPSDPTNCTLAFSVVDRDQLVRESIGARCWTVAGAIRPGPC